MVDLDARYLTANIPVFLLRCMAATLTALGSDPARLTVGLGLTLDDLADPACRVSFRQGREMIRRGLKMAKGHALGLETGARETITSIGIVGFAMITSATVGEAIKLGLELQKDAGSMLEFDLKLDKRSVAVIANSRFHDPEIHGFLVEEAFASFLQIGRGLVGDNFKPVRIDLAYPAPPHADAYKRIFGCEIRFGQTSSAFVYDPVWYSTPLMTSDLLSHRQVMSFLEHNRDRNKEAIEIIESVERVLRHNLQQLPTFAEVASNLGMSERTLRRRLNECEVSFQSLLDGLRRTRALELLANPQLSVEQIAFAVGFTDPHNFRRAFRRWTGSTPGAMRTDMSKTWPQ
jgi:AraC-like DNA-binding protein